MNLDHVELTDAQSAFVADRIARYASERADGHDWMVPYVEKYRIQYEGLRAEEQSGLVLGSLVLGARKYPQLQTIVPARPQNALTCEDCAANGVAEHSPSMICSCGVVGWRIPN